MGYLKDLRLPTTAETDEDLLSEDIFVRSSSFEHMTNPMGVLVIGRKGAGKTAIRKGLKHFKSIKNDLWIDLSLKNLSPSELSRVIRKSGGRDKVADKQQLLHNVWRCCFLWTFMAHAMHPSRKDGLSEELRQRIENYFRRFSVDIDSIVKNGSKDCLPDTVLDRILTTVDPPLDVAGRRDYPVTKDLADIESDVLDWSSRTQGVVYAIDDLDPSLDQYDDVLIPLSRSLISFCYNYREQHPEAKIMFKCFIPKDMILALRRAGKDRHLDRVLGDASEIRWTRTTLLSLLGARVRAAYESDLKGQSRNQPLRAVELILGQQVAGYEGGIAPFDLLLYHTFFRPRDLFNLLKSMIETTRQEDPNASMIPGHQFFHLLQRATSDYCRAIVDEMQGVYPELSSDIDAIRGEPAVMTTGELHHAWQTKVSADNDPLRWKEKLKIFYHAGVIGIEVQRADVTGRPVKEFEFVHNNPGLESTSGENDRIAVHPMFWSSYGVKYRPFKASRP